MSYPKRMTPQELVEMGFAVCDDNPNKARCILHPISVGLSSNLCFGLISF